MTATNWIFTIVLVLLFIIILQTQILTPMNTTYNKTYTTGLDTSGLDKFTELKTTSHTTIQGAEATQTSDGLTLKDAWTVGKGAYGTIVSFIDGSFINNLVMILDMPPIIATVLTLLIWISLIMIIVYIFMKVVP